MQIQGSATTSTNLPASGNTTGDGYLTADDGHLWVWGGTSWTDVGLIQGPAGATGPQGPVGAQGAQGPTGAQGPAGQDGVEPAPAWRLGGNSGTNNWLGTDDNTDLVMKVNNQPQLRLGSNGVTELMQEIRFASFADASTSTTRLTGIGPDGTVVLLDPSVVQEYWDLAQPCKTGQDGLPIPHWKSGSAKIFTDCSPVNVGIGTQDPLARLDVRGRIYGQFMGVNTYGLQARFTVKASTVNDAVEFLDQNGTTSLVADKDGKIIIGSGYFNQTWDRASLYLGNGVDHFVSAIHGKGLSLSTYGAQDALLIEQNTGKVGIGVGVNHNFGEGLLEVNGTIRSKRVVVEQTGWWPDYVFDDDHNLMELSELREFISKQGHLPNIPSAEEIETSGLDLGQLLKLQMQKIEELTLYILQLEERMNEESDKE